MGFRVLADGSGDSRRDGGLCAESPAGAEELVGAEENRCAEEIAGAMAIASVGGNIRRLLLLLTVLRESYVEGTTFSGGLPSYVSNRLVVLMIV